MPDPVDRQTFWIVVSALSAGITVGYGLWWAHERKCRDRERQEGKLEEKVKHIENEIGDHDKGIIAQLHRYSKAITRIFTKLNLED